ncbi:MAG: hypothetical protein ACI4RP_04840, partial [Acutalibacteraceae bacterium]
LNIVGIGGTKGKSTSAYYMKTIVDDYMEATGGKESAVISSIDIYDGVIKKESHITTPSASSATGAYLIFLSKFYTVRVSEAGLTFAPFSTNYYIRQIVKCQLKIIYTYVLFY